MRRVIDQALKFTCFERRNSNLGYAWWKIRRARDIVRDCTMSSQNYFLLVTFEKIVSGL